MAWKAEDLWRKKWDTHIKGFHLDFKNGAAIAKTDQDKLKQFAE